MLLTSYYVIATLPSHTSVTNLLVHQLCESQVGQPTPNACELCGYKGWFVQ